MSRQLTSTEILILALLNIQPKFGYQIVANARTFGFEEWLNYSKAHVYRSIPKLLKLGLIEPHSQDRYSENAKKAFLKITALGREKLFESLSSPHWSEVKNSNDFLIWVEFMLLCGSFNKKHPILMACKKFLTHQLEQEKKVRFQLLRENPFNPSSMLERVNSFKLEQLKAELSWLKA